MKTEGLDYREALVAYLDGKCVADKDGDPHKLEGNYSARWIKNQWKTGFGLLPGLNPYSIVPDPSIPEPKSLTMEEAWDILRHPRKTAIKIKSGVPFIDSWTMTAPLNESLLLLDLAERRGWPITEVTQ